MADGRDLTLSLVSDESQFDTTGAARDLQQLGDAADDTSRQQADLGDAANRAQGDLDRLTQAARDAGGAVRSIDDDAQAAQDGLDSLEDGAEQTGGAFGDFRDEAAANLMEVAGSFDGTVQGLIEGAQGALPALGAAFGGLGLALGSAAALGVGILKAQAEALKEEAGELTSQLITDGGKLSRESLLGKLGEMAADGRLTDLADQAREAKVPLGDFMLAAAGDVDALDRTNDALRRRRDAIYEVTDAERSGAVYDSEGAGAREEQRQAVERATGAINEQAEAQRLAAENVAAYEDALAAADKVTERSTEVQEAYTDALSGVTDEAADMAAAIEEGIDAVIAAQERQISAAADFQENTTRVFEAVGQAGVDWALAQGEYADEAMQLLADAPKAKQQEIVTNYATIGRGAGAAAAAGIRAAAADATAAATELVRAAQRGLDERPLIIRTRIDPTGYDSGLRTIVRNGSVNV